MRCKRILLTFHCSSDPSLPWCKPASISYATECCWDSLSLNDTFWSVSHVCFIHEVKSGHCSQVLLLLNQSLHFLAISILLLFFSALPFFFFANPMEVALPPPPLLLPPPRAGFNRHVCRLSHEVACCPESATSHVLSLSCTFKKLYLKKERFHLGFLIQIRLSPRRISFSYFFLITDCLKITNIHVYINI